MDDMVTTPFVSFAAMPVYSQSKQASFSGHCIQTCSNCGTLMYMYIQCTTQTQQYTDRII